MKVRIKRKEPFIVRMMRKDDASCNDVITGVKIVGYRVYWDNESYRCYNIILVETKKGTYRYDGAFWSAYKLRSGMWDRIF